MNNNVQFGNKNINQNDGLKEIINYLLKQIAMKWKSLMHYEKK